MAFALDPLDGFQIAYGPAQWFHLVSLRDGQTQSIAVAAGSLAVLAEELGFLGAIAVLGLFYYLIYRAIMAARSSQDRLGTYICLLVAAWITGQMAINVGMVLGLLPTIGVPLPFVSYGGSALVAMCCGIALIMNVRSRRFVNI